MTFDLSRWLPEFPIRERCLYLNHAAVCPLPQLVATAMRERITDQELSGYEKGEKWRLNTLACRHMGSQLIGCEPEDISIVRSTSEGLSLIAEGLDWQPGDEVLLGSQEFAANAGTWLNLARRGVKVVRFEQVNGQVDPATIAALLGPATRVLAVSWVAFFSGWVAPLQRLAELCWDNDTLLVVDAIQGLGLLAERPAIQGADAVVADAHKWLLGPEGVALMATTPRLRAQLRPVLVGWRNVKRGRDQHFLESLEFLEDGRRFEPGATNDVGIAGLAAALDLILAAGPQEISSRVEMLVYLLTRLLIAHGWDVVSPGSGHPVSGIVAARHPEGDPHEIVHRLGERQIICSTRQGLVRFSPHFYITKGEIEAFDRILGKIGL